MKYSEGIDMARDFKPSGIHLTAGIAPCAYYCRYCQMGYGRPAKFGIGRFEKMLNRFFEYKEKLGSDDFDVSHWLGYTYDLDKDDFAVQIRMFEKSGWNPKLLLMGGVRHRHGDELVQWLTERRGMGMERVVATYFGLNEQHDYMNNKEGHFEYQIELQKLAGELGYRNEQRMFLLRSTMPVMEQLLDRLEEVGASVTDKCAYPLFYSGRARRYDGDRVTMELLENQPERVKAVYRNDIYKWKSEKDWIEAAKGEASSYESGHVSLLLTDDNIEKYEDMSCEEIYRELTERTQTAYAAAPTREELCEKYSDPTNERLYMFMWDMECLWMDRYLKENPVSFERLLTHFGR